MPANFRQLDARELDTLRLPYDKFAKKLHDIPILVSGSNIYAAQNNTLRKRGGTGGTTALTDETVTGRIDRIGAYETLESPSKVYLIASVYNGTNWEMFYLRLSAGTPQWTTMGTVRDVDDSTRAHEWVVARGKVYIQGFPGSGDKLGTVVFDGSGGSPVLTVWGLLGPTTPGRIVSPASWNAATDPVTVLVGWTYVYTWKTLTGHESTRSPLEFDPANAASSTGAFTNKCPQVTVQGHADTTNITKVVIYRSGDGGGNYMRLAEITNTGAGNIVYEDDDLDGDNPIPTGNLDPHDLAPSLTSNSSVPTVLDPLVVGTDQVATSTAMVYWQGRIWKGLGNFLFFSGQEEIRSGIPEECWPSGILSGNKFKFQYGVSHLIPTKDILYVVTSRGVQAITGQFRDEFKVRGLSELVGGAILHPHASLAIEQEVYWLTHDYQIAHGNLDSFEIISRPLSTDITAELGTNREIEFGSYIAPGIAWLLVLAKHQTTPAASKVWVYDLESRQWNPPWSGAYIESLTYGPISESDRVPKLLFALWSGGTVSTSTSVAGEYTDATFTDFVPGSAVANIAFSAETNLFPLPGGNRINSVTRPAITSNFAGWKLEWISGVTAPTVAYALDDASGSVTTATGEDTYLHTAPVGYVTKFYHVETMAERAKLKISRTADAESFVLESIAACWQVTQSA